MKIGKIGNSIKTDLDKIDSIKGNYLNYPKPYTHALARSNSVIKLILMSVLYKKDLRRFSS